MNSPRNDCMETNEIIPSFADSCVLSNRESSNTDTIPGFNEIKNEENTHLSFPDIQDMYLLKRSDTNDSNEQINDILYSSLEYKEGFQDLQLAEPSETQLMHSEMEVSYLSHSPVKRRFSECGAFCRSHLKSMKRCNNNDKYSDLKSPVRHDLLYGDVFPSHHSETFFVFSKMHLSSLSIPETV